MLSFVSLQIEITYSYQKQYLCIVHCPPSHHALVAAAVKHRLFALHNCTRPQPVSFGLPAQSSSLASAVRSQRFFSSAAVFGVNSATIRLRDQSMLLLSSVVLLLPLSLVAAIPSQFEASCPGGCSCTAYKIVCENVHSKNGQDIFLHASPRIYPDLDTLQITGNNFGDLHGANIFGEGVENSKVTLANFSLDGITDFDEKTFQGLKGVEFLYLGNNNLTEVGDHPFRSMEKLKYLDLTNVFGRGVSARQKADILRKMFQANEDQFVELKEVILDDNGLEFLHPDTFCKITGLGQLHLKNNNLKDFPIPKNGACFPSLKNLVLEGNQFAVIHEHLYNGPIELTGFDVSRNPLKCDCTAKNFVKYAQREDSFFINQDYTTCAWPVEHQNKKLFQIQPEDLCPSSGGHSLFFFLLVVFLIAVFGYRYARVHNITLSLPTRIPFVAGYSVLKSNDDGTVPQFV
uniref:LRRCT domain-containing protein n=1 Tax=Steinernema glaseri TaxID=37863 RepID=A0A1I7ZAK2_9BILA